MFKLLIPLFIFVFSTQVTFINGSEIDPFEKYYNDVLKEHSLTSDGKNKNIHKKYFSILETEAYECVQKLSNPKHPKYKVRVLYESDHKFSSHFKGDNYKFKTIDFMYSEMPEEIANLDDKYTDPNSFYYLFATDTGIKRFQMITDIEGNYTSVYCYDIVGGESKIVK